MIDYTKVAIINYKDLNDNGYHYGYLAYRDESLEFEYLFKCFKTLEELEKKIPNINMDDINGESIDEEWLKEDEFEFMN